MTIFFLILIGIGLLILGIIIGIALSGVFTKELLKFKSEIIGEFNKLKDEFIKLKGKV